MFHVYTEHDDITVRVRCVARTPERAAAEAALRMLGPGHVIYWKPLGLDVYVGDKLVFEALPPVMLRPHGAQNLEAARPKPRAPSRPLAPVKPNRDAMGYDRLEDRDE